MTEKQVQALLVRAVKTFAQAFVAVFLLGVLNVISSLLSTGNFSAAKSALVALVTAALAAGVSALMNAYIKPEEAK